MHTANRRRLRMESNENSVAKGNEEKPIEFGNAAIDMSWMFSPDQESPLVTIKCGSGSNTKVFTVLKCILTKNSEFFAGCLRNQCRESASSTIELPEVLPGLMMLYLTLATRQAVMNGKSMNKKALVSREDFATPTGIKAHVQFYQLCDFLRNDKLASSVRDMLVDYLKGLTCLPDESICPKVFRIYAETFGILEPGHVAQAKLRRILVKSFCLYITASVYFKHSAGFESHPEFLTQISKQYILNGMWNDPVHKKAAAMIKTQRMSIDDESEPEQ
ncbi:hypothetical protein CcaCcLH18_06948 [Colletotrichum camelliae]|nr:hypothetical protein CcaCcLH18_06948 [Colletotrichum camelliae]